MQRAEMEELRQREANLTALQAIGPRKKPRIDGPETTTASSGQVVHIFSHMWICWACLYAFCFVTDLFIYK